MERRAAWRWTPFLVSAFCWTILMADEGEVLQKVTPRHFVLQYLGVILAIITAAVYMFNPPSRTPFFKKAALSSDAHKHQRLNSVPFVAMVEPDWKVLRKSLDAYRVETRQSLEQLSIALEGVMAEEERVGCSKLKFSDYLREKIHRLSDIYDNDLDILQQQVLIPFPATLALPQASSVATPNKRQDHGVEKEEELGFTWWSSSRSRRMLEEQRPYDSARQVVAHLVRDWSASEGAPIRASLYGWCVEQLKLYQPPSRGPVLVPGAGLGRLAWELATNLDCSVEAVESSVSMAAAAYAILHLNEQQSSFELHPYAADSFTNEVDSSARYDVVSFPDQVPTMTRGSLSYTIGDFGYENMLHLRNHYSAVVTCFFLDTATTVYDYLTTISTILSPRGVWVNLGPLQWHINSQVPVAVDELRKILQSFCDGESGKPMFEILHWRVDEQPVSYRNHGRHRSTHFDAYCPLRFVLRKR